MVIRRSGGKFTDKTIKPAKLQLESLWQEVAIQAGIPAMDASALFADLCERYSAPDRHYHNLTHITQMLEIVSQSGNELHDYVAVCLAVWFHDVSYDTRRQDNEEQSAAHANAALTRCGIANSLQERVQELILATKTHHPLPDDSDGQLLLDIDLQILGSSFPEYDEYAQAIRQEYAWVEEESYRQGRGQVLRRFLQRSRLYGTEAFFQTLEQPARSNLEREIEQLAL